MSRWGAIADRLLAWAAAGLLGYWALYVAVAPVVTGDAHGYNLARLLVAERHGLFDNPYWTNINQIVFPWTFDAVHYPFLKLGVLENAPSFLCFAGLLCVVVLFLRREGAGRLWPLAALAFLASPMLILQGTTTKNDFPLLFLAAAGAWFVSQWLSGDRRWWLPVVAALCAGFAVGTKTTGILLVAGLTIAALYASWKNGWRGFAIYCAALVVSLGLFGSVETAINNSRTFGDWKGETGFIEWHQHSDGIMGGAANAVRYFFNGLPDGLDPNFMASPASVMLKDACLSVLHALGLERVGFRKFEPPESFYILVSNVDSQTTFGLAGLVAALASLALLAGFRFRRVWWWLALGGWVFFGAFCMKVGWGNTNLRMLTPAYGLWISAVALALAPWLRDHAGWRRTLGVALLTMAVCVPMFANGRSPAAIAEALQDREGMMLSERPGLREELQLADRVRRDNPELPALVVLGAKDWVVPYLQGSHGKWNPVPNPWGLRTLDAVDLRKLYPWLPAGDVLLVVSQNSRLDVEGETHEFGVAPNGARVLRVTVPPPDSAALR